MDNTKRLEGVDYVLGNVSGTDAEYERLDDLHEALKSHLNGNLSLAPLEESVKPNRILEIGSGSGAWAVQAATTFPDAEVLAIDVTPLPNRTLPSNLTFKVVDITKSFPAEFEEGFDIIHARLLFIHLPHPEQIIKRVAQIVKPGGWLLLDDAHQAMGVKCDPGWLSLSKLLQDSLKARDMDPFIGARFKEILQSTGLFSEMNTKALLLPLCRPPIDTIKETSLQRIGGSCRRGLLRTLGNMTAIGLTPALIQLVQKELDDPNGNAYTELVMTWSKRCLVE